MARGDITISIYQPAAVLAASEPDHLHEPVTLRVYPRWAASLVAGAATLILHLIFLDSVGWPFGTTKGKGVMPMGAVVEARKAFSAMEVVLLDDLAEQDYGPPKIEPELLPVKVSMPSVPDIAVEGEAPPRHENDSLADAGSGVVYGLYVRQADGRMQRLCSARIDRDRAGHVLEVSLERCNGNGDLAWQRAIIDAIRSVTLRPLQVDQRIFRPVITLIFQGQACTSATQPDLYEPVNAVRDGA